MFLVYLFICTNWELLPSGITDWRGVTFLRAIRFSLVQDLFMVTDLLSMQTPDSPSRDESTLARHYEEAYSAHAINTKIKGRPHSLNYAHYVLKLRTCFVLYISHLHQRESLPCFVPRMEASGFFEIA